MMARKGLSPLRPLVRKPLTSCSTHGLINKQLMAPRRMYSNGDWRFDMYRDELNMIVKFSAGVGAVGGGLVGVLGADKGYKISGASKCATSGAILTGGVALTAASFYCYPFRTAAVVTLGCAMFSKPLPKKSESQSEPTVSPPVTTGPGNR